MKFEKEEELKLDKPLNYEVGLVEELEISITKNCELSVELEKKNKEFISIQEKFNDFEFSKIAVDNDLKECKKTNDGLKERIIPLEEDKRDICGREKGAEERILFLEEQINQFKTEIRDLEKGKSRAENVTEIWKKRCRELETRVLMAEEGSSSLRCLESHVSGKIVMESTCLRNENSYGDTGKKEMSEDGRKNEKMFAESNHPSPPHRGNIDAHVTGPMTIDRQHEPSISTKKHKKNTGLGSNVEVENKRRKKIDFEIEERKIALLGLDSVKSAGIVEISDCEDDERGEKYDVRCEADTVPLSSTPKRKRCSKIVLTDSESEEDDTTPIGKLKMKKMEQPTGILIPKLCPLSPYTGDVAVSSDGEHVEESVTPSRRRLMSLRQCEEKKSRVDETPNFEYTSPDNVKIGASSQEKVCNLTAENDEEKVSEESGSESEGDSLGGFIVDDCGSSDSGDSSSDSEDPVDSELDGDQVMELKWQFEGDMLSSFGKDPIPCMKAVCALYRQQTAEEKSFKGSLHLNKRGFSKFDARRGTHLAEFLTDGSEEGDLVKSVEELEMFDPKGLEDCRTLASRYSKQLFTIYQNQEDPLFGP